MYKDIKSFRYRRKKTIVRCLGGKCNRCGYNKYDGALDLHHIDKNNKLYNIADLLRDLKKVSVLIEECKKCVLLCRICHCELHAGLWDINEISLFKFDESQLDWYILKPERVCVICKQTYKPRAKLQKCCSDKCSRLVRRKATRPSKEELEKLVWSKPTSQIARHFNLSDNSIVKWCKKYGIQKPSRGYWMKNNYVTKPSSTE